MRSLQYPHTGMTGDKLTATSALGLALPTRYSNVPTQLPLLGCHLGLFHSIPSGRKCCQKVGKVYAKSYRSPTSL